MEYHSKYTGAEVDALLDKVESGDVGGKVTVDSALSTTSENPVMNKVITEELNKKATPMKSVTYAELVNLRDNGELLAGMQYRITDYVTTTIQANTQSAGHPFDVIVLALSESELSEQAWAIHSARDTDGYFANSKLSAWKIWYSLDNDTDRFVWVDTANGKGVIYRMIDEWNNDCLYDFKNIQFKHPHNDIIYSDFYYTFSTVISGVVGDHSHNGGYCYGNAIGLYGSVQNQLLNRIVFINTSKISACYSNSFGNRCYSNSFGNNCHSNSFGNSCNSNSFGNYCYFNSFGTYCHTNSFGNDCYDNSFGNSCNSNSFGNYCYFNSFGNYCHTNSFGNDCHRNSFGNSCYSNSFGNYCYRNSFGNYCYDNSFGNYCNSNSFGNSCYSNSFGNKNNSNSFGNSCYSNSFGTYCRYNKADDGVSVILNNSKTASSNQQIQNYHLTLGLTSKTIEVERNRAYQTTVAIDSSGNVKQFCIADIIQ